MNDTNTCDPHVAASSPTAEQRFAEIFDTTNRRLLAYAARRVDVPADAADIVAETYLVAWRRIDDVPSGDAAVPWLFGVARHLLGNHYRGTRRRLALADRLRDDLASLPEPAPAPDEHSRVLDALARLSADDQEILRLDAWEQLQPDEIAQEGVNMGSPCRTEQEARAIVTAITSRLGLSNYRLAPDVYDNTQAGEIGPDGKETPPTTPVTTTCVTAELDDTEQTVRFTLRRREEMDDMLPPVKGRPRGATPALREDVRRAVRDAAARRDADANTLGAAMDAAAKARGLFGNYYEREIIPSQVGTGLRVYDRAGRYRIYVPPQR